MEMRGEEQRVKELCKDTGGIRNLPLQTYALKGKDHFSSGLTNSLHPKRPEDSHSIYHNKE